MRRAARGVGEVGGCGHGAGMVRVIELVIVTFQELDFGTLREAQKRRLSTIGYCVVRSEAAIQPSGLSVPTWTQPFALPKTSNFSPCCATRMIVADVLGPLLRFAVVLTVTTGRLGVRGWTDALDGS